VAYYCIAKRQAIVCIDNPIIFNPVLVKRNWRVVHPHAYVLRAVHGKKHANAISPAVAVAYAVLIHISLPLLQWG
jgi:hypothetical protein